MLMEESATGKEKRGQEVEKRLKWHSLIEKDPEEEVEENKEDVDGNVIADM
jgi:hypothetical protein